MGVVIELLKMRMILLVAIILLIAQIFIEPLPAFVPILIFAACFAVALFNQIKQRNAILTMNPHDEANDLLNKMFADNDKGYKNVIDAVDEIIERETGGEK
jgi:hypothetical protein